jgi:hypothetical protein
LQALGFDVVEAAETGRPSYHPSVLLKIYIYEDQLDGARGRGHLLRAETYRRLQTPVSGNYAFGWGAASAPDGSLRVLAHTGSNGNWPAEVGILPRQEAILHLVENAANGDAQAALDEVVDDWMPRASLASPTPGE